MNIRPLGLALAFGLAAWAQPVTAQEVRTYSKTAPYEDVKFDLVNAIETQGLTIEFSGQLGKMLDRTGPDVGSTTRIYTQAEFFTFCSAKYSRRMMEADPLNIGFCPYVVFVYEDAAKPGEIVVGYRRPTPRGDDASTRALSEIDALLDGIVKAAAQ